MGEGEIKGQSWSQRGRHAAAPPSKDGDGTKAQQKADVVRRDISCVNLCIIWCAIVLRRASASLREIVVVDGLSIRVPRGASYIDRLQIDKHADTHTHAHTYVHRAV